ncbi:PorP/SprF family type IX secretion system membrane protein [Reichenbachiella agarivorans]|uniref:PorP/SprF family type IX secretion system membrane protein n=1 Tax=Reichenbachiella agarivorans TaxID=2979464 RepID=A0ABY6CTB0_9BACT|nr:PorP/SprF family type IX secretion system membrane protein [Reichenbachiella agarivorans]UXP33755.1 PorP/SprF family type IX secretion system membrane protein [Reichenbachiella agarivorans]
MRKLILLMGFLYLGLSTSMAQQDPVFSHFMFNPYYNSPALTAFDGLSSISLISRNQWTGYDPSFESEGGAPTTQFFNYTAPLHYKKAPMGIGGTFIYDQFGPRQDVYVQMSLSYHLDMPRGRFSLGLRPSVSRRVLDYSKLVTVDPTDLDQTQVQSQMMPDLAAGLAYSSHDYMIAFGIDHLLTPSFDFGYGEAPTQSNRQEMVYSLYATYSYLMSEYVELKPAILARTNISGFSYDISVRAVYMTKVWAGLSYRDSEAITVLLGYSFFGDKSLSLGYSFDYIVNDREYKQSTSHELYVHYNLPTLNGRTKKIIRTPRFRF